MSATTSSTISGANAETGPRMEAGVRASPFAIVTSTFELKPVNESAPARPSGAGLTESSCRTMVYG